MEKQYNLEIFIEYIQHFFSMKPKGDVTSKAYSVK